jgi:hypothetical protein
MRSRSRESGDVPSALDQEALAAEAAALNADGGYRGWGVTHVEETLQVYAQLTPAGSTDRYCVRLDFGERLSVGPPSVTFCEPESHVEGQPRDWPRGLTDYFKAPPNNGVGWICNEWTREGRQHHSEWTAKGWRPTRVIWRVVSALHDILDKPGNYQGRNV